VSRVLIAHSTTDGHTPLICKRLRRGIEAAGQHAVVRPICETDAADLAAADVVVVGASIRYGKHKPEVGAFIARHRAALEARPNAFFSVNVVARKPGKDVPEGNPYLQTFLKTIAWKPQRLAVFAGRIDYPRYGWGDRTMIRLIMWMTRGPTDPTRSYEFTDWSRVDAFAAELAGLGAARAARAAPPVEAGPPMAA
jgi:menaquinone-dependent protoporphyrinogen oxidase